MAESCSLKDVTRITDALVPAVAFPPDKHN